jgi:hypothetical protein
VFWSLYCCVLILVLLYFLQVDCIKLFFFFRYLKEKSIAVCYITLMFK